MLNTSLKRKFLSLVLALLISVSLLNISSPPSIANASIGSTFYVDATGGNDSNNGLSANLAWKTLDRVSQEIFGPGDTILFKAGEIWDGQLFLHGSGSPGNPITVDMYPSNVAYKPVIRTKGEIVDYSPLFSGGIGIQSYCIELKNAQYWEINNLELTVSPHWNNNHAVPAGIRIWAENADSVVLNHIYVQNCYIHELVSQFLWNGVFYEKTGTAVFFDVLGETVPNTFNDILVANNVMERVATGVRTDSYWTLFPGYEIYTGGGVTGGQGLVYYEKLRRGPFHAFTNVTVINNIVKNTQDTAIIIMASEGAVIQNNLVKSVGALGTASQWNIGIICEYTKNSVIRYNEVYDTSWPGIGNSNSCDLTAFNISRSHGIIVEHNYSHNNHGGFILIDNYIRTDLYHNNIVRYNISQNDGIRAFKFCANGLTKIYNNVFYNSTTRPGIEYYYHWNNLHGPIHNIHFYNNIWYGFNVSGPNTSLGATATFDYNNFFNGNGPSQANPVIGNPKFVNPGSGPTGSNTITTTGYLMAALEGYKLQLDSPCIDSGVNINNIWPGDVIGATDFWGTPLYQGIPNVGAHESDSGVVTPVITINTQPQNTTVTHGSINGNVTVGATVTNNATLNYQWYKVADTNGNQAGDYSIDFTNAASFGSEWEWSGGSAVWGPRTAPLEYFFDQGPWNSWSLTSNGLAITDYCVINGNPADWNDPGNFNLGRSRFEMVSLLRDMPAGDWKMTAKMEFDPAYYWHYGGLIVFSDADNYLYTAKSWDSGGLRCFNMSIVPGAANSGVVSSINIGSGEIVLEISKIGNTYLSRHNIGGVWSSSTLLSSTIPTNNVLHTSNDLKIGLLCADGAVFKDFSVEVIGGSGVPSDTKVGINSPNLMIPTTLTEGVHNFYCIVGASGGASSVTSNTVTVTVNPSNTIVPAITINTEPQDITVTAGNINDNLTVGASINTNEPLSFQWYQSVNGAVNGAGSFAPYHYVNFTNAGTSYNVFNNGWNWRYGDQLPDEIDVDSNGLMIRADKKTSRDTLLFDTPDPHDDWIVTTTLDLNLNGAFPYQGAGLSVVFNGKPNSHYYGLDRFIFFHKFNEVNGQVRWQSGDLLGVPKYNTGLLSNTSEIQLKIEKSGNIYKLLYREDSGFDDAGWILAQQITHTSINSISVGIIYDAGYTSSWGPITNEFKVFFKDFYVGPKALHPRVCITSGSLNGDKPIGNNNPNFAIPTTMSAGEYYFYCVVSAPDAEQVISRVVTVTVTP